MDSLDPKLKELLEKYHPHFSLQENGKILCSINSHTLPPRFDEFSKFIQGPKFQKLLKRHQAENALQKYEPFIVQSKNFPLMLYCALTGQLMDKSVEAVKKHMQGKKFQRAKDRFANDEIDLKPEPSLESFGVKLPKDQEAAAAAEGAGNERGRKSNSKQQQGKAAANGAAAAVDEQESSEEGPAFWAPSDDESASESDQEGEEGEASSGDEQVEDADMDAETGTPGDPMDEDEAPQQHKTATTTTAAARNKKQKAVAAAGAAAFGTKSSTQKHRQQQRHEGQGSGAKKKQNVNRPSAAKKAKR